MNRAINLIKKEIDKWDLDLSGYTILTEVGSNHYVYTPIIAAIAGAKKVFVWTADSRFGRGGDNIDRCKEICKQLNISSIEFSNNQKPINQIKEADIITNSGFLRPLDSTFVSGMKSGSSISLMFEKWELRAEDIDIEACRENNIKVAGVWENHPDLMVFSGIGALAVKMSMQAGYEVYQNNIIVWSDDDFGKEAAESFLKMGATSVNITTDPDELYSKLDRTDFIFICDYDEKRPYFQNSDSILDIDKMIKLNSSFGVVHLYGEIGIEILQKNNIVVSPNVKGAASVMTFTLAHLGLSPIIKLQTAGFKVGQMLQENKKTTLTQYI